MEVIQNNTDPQGENLSVWGYFVRCITKSTLTSPDVRVARSGGAISSSSYSSCRSCPSPW